MSTNNSLQHGLASSEDRLVQPVSRRKFLLFAGASAGVMALAASCKKDDDNNMNGGVDLGKDDIGILNYAYALEQLEAAFYTQVIATQYSGITASETALLTDIRDHEVAHREFSKPRLVHLQLQTLK